MRNHLQLFAISIFIALAAGPSHGDEIKKMAKSCENKICFWFQTQVKPPNGWVVDADASRENLVTILLPDKKKLTFDDPMIYVQTAYRPDAMSFDDMVAKDLENLRKGATPRAKITPIGEAARAGKPPFKLFLFENPDAPRQAVEKIAYELETLPNGERYYLTVVDTAANRRAIDGSEGAYTQVLSGL